MNTLQLLTVVILSLSSAFVIGRMVGETSSSADISTPITK